MIKLSIDIWEKIILYLDNRQDILSSFLTCEHLYKVTERYSFWKQINNRYKDAYLKPEFRSIHIRKKHPKLEDLRFGTQAHFHYVQVVEGHIIKFNIDELFKTNFSFSEEIIGIYNILTIGYVVIHRGINNAIDIQNNDIRRWNNYSKYLKYPRNDCFIVKNKYGSVSLKHKSAVSDSQVKKNLFQDNLYSIFVDFIKELQGYFEFDEIIFAQHTIIIEDYKIVQDYKILQKPFINELDGTRLDLFFRHYKNGNVEFYCDDLCKPIRIELEKPQKYSPISHLFWG